MKDAELLQQVIDKDPRYALEAYLFVLEALFYARKKLNKEGHVTGQELLEGIKDLASQRYGLMAKTVLEHWGIKRTLDFGNIVFNMVNDKVLGKTPEDSIDDFKDIYDFDEVFVKNYRLEAKKIKDAR